MRRFAIAVTALLAFASPASAASRGAWDRSDQHAAAQAGLMHVLDDGAFHGERALTGAQLRQSRDALAARLDVQPANLGALASKVSVAAFDRAIVRQLGLADVAKSVQYQARRRGLHPPARFGTEVVARLLGLRFNHPAGTERLELYPWQAITRAEAAYSFARLAQFGGWEVEAARQTLARFVLPRYTVRQQRALRVAVSKIGMPYIWGGGADAPPARPGPGGHDRSRLARRGVQLTRKP